MTIKYGELTIIKDNEQSNLSTLLYWIINEEYLNIFSYLTMERLVMQKK